MEVGELAKQFDHAVVVLEGVQARPRENIAASFWVAVLRLMHVPQHNQMDAIHSAGVPKRGSRRWFVATGIDRIKVNRQEDRKSTRLNSSHGYISYAVFCLKKKNNTTQTQYAITITSQS